MALENCNDLTKLLPLEVGTQQLYIRGGPAPRSNPSPFLCTTFDRKGTLFFSLSLKNELITNLERFPAFFIAIKCHLLALYSLFSD